MGINLSRSAPLTGGGTIGGDLHVEGDITVDGTTTLDLDATSDGDLYIGGTTPLISGVDATSGSGPNLTLAASRAESLSTNTGGGN